MAVVSYVRRLASLAEEAPDRPAITCGGTTLTRAGLEVAANRRARELAALGAGTGSMVTIALPNSAEWLVTALAAWKVGAVPQPVNASLPDAELQAILDLADPAVVVGIDPDRAGGRPTLPAGHEPAPDTDGSPLPDVVSPAWKAPTSGGSTGRPKLIVSGERAELDPEAPAPWLLQPGGGVVLPGPLSHNGPFLIAAHALLHGNHLVLLERFDGEETLRAVERHGADVLYLVPTMMKRIWRLPEATRHAVDLSTLRVVWHLAEPCPAWLKAAWIDWLGPDRIWELYAGTEGQATTLITGREWLAHRGSVGRPIQGEVTVRDHEGRDLPPGEHGEVWMRSTGGRTTYRYVGAEARATDDGWESLGDRGYLDEDGYLYLVERMQDMVLVGGRNVYPAEVEAVLLQHDAVRSCAVIGLPDEGDLGNIVHAIVEADPGEVTVEELAAHTAASLARYKLPRTFELVQEPLRSDAGKVRRSELRRERLARR